MAEVDSSASVRKLTGAPLEVFERAVYGRPKENRIAENDAAVRSLRECLMHLREGVGFDGHPQLTPALMTRMCSAITALFLDPGFNLTQDGFDFLMSEKAVMDTLFRASAFGGADHIYGLIEETETHPLKYLMLFSPNSKLELDLERIFRENPQATVGLYLALIGYGQIVTKEGHERREKLLSLAPIFKDVNLPATLWNAVCSAYMHCSYASGDHKHDCKRVLHELVGKTLRQSIPQAKHVARGEKPRLLCVFEWWWSKHAMFRSYAASIRQLRKSFHLIGCCAGKNTDQEARDIFDEWVELDGDNMNLADVVPMIASKNADIIYYPSIGMAIWVIALASLRLAPIQVMTYGHPATSNSPEIDYGLIEADCLNEKCFSERMIALPPNTVRPTEYTPLSIKHEAKKQDVVKVAIPAMQVKLTYPFIQALKQVQAKSKKKIEFWFFSAAKGIGLYTLAGDIAGQIEGVWVQEMQPYEEYVASIAGCDLALFSFPFGGANSCYDAISVGLPMVSLKGDQPHSMSDASIITRAGLPQSLITHSVEEYVDRIVQLIDNDEERIEIAKLVSAVDMAQFYKPDETGAFLKAFENIYAEKFEARLAA